MNYLVATTKPWNIAEYERRVSRLPGTWSLVQKPGDLTLEALLRLKPRYAFFPHWSWRVPDEILSSTECVCFHMTDVPYGRGGSPLQNLILRGHHETMISALRMESEMDSGPVYLKRPLSLEGRAQEIFERAAIIVFDMIENLVAAEPTAVLQSGDPLLFTRRTPEQSRLPEAGDSRRLFDFIRMLDADTYPQGFIEYGSWRLEFSHAELTGETVETRVTFKPRRG